MRVLPWSCSLDAGSRQCGSPSGGAPHAVRACLYAGDCRLIVVGNSRIAPSKLLISWMPVGLAGTEVLGSGNWGTRCWRMHTAILSSFVSVCAEGGGPESGLPLSGRSFWHFALAALNAGAAGLAPAGISKSCPPPSGGSGKLGTPLARMHLANASAPEPPLDEPELVAAVLVIDRALVAAEAPVDAEVLVPPAVAAFPELPPQPATSTPPMSAAAVSTCVRDLSRSI